MATKYATSALKLSDTYVNTLPYNLCETAAGTAAKAVSAGDFALETGAMVVVKFKNTNSAANPTLNVSSTGAKAIYYKGAAITASYLKANYTYTFVYNGAQWELVGEIDTNTTYTIPTSLPANGGNADTVDNKHASDFATAGHNHNSSYVAKNADITGATKCKITYDKKGLVTSGADLEASDIPNLAASKITSGTFADARIASAATWNAKQNAISDLDTIRSGAAAGATAVQPATLNSYVTTSDSRLSDARTPVAHNQASNTITAMTGYSKASSASAIAAADSLNKAIGKLEKALDGKTSNAGTVTSVRVQAGTGLSSSVSTAQTGTLNTTISVASGYKLPTTDEWNAKGTSNLTIGTTADTAAAGNHNHDSAYLGKSAQAADSAKLGGKAASSYLTSHQDISGKLDKNTAITGATKCKITYDAKGLVTGGADLAASDIPNLAASKITSGTISTSRLPAASGSSAGITIVYPAASCTTFTSDSGTCTPAAVKKAVGMFEPKAHTHTVSQISDFPVTPYEKHLLISNAADSVLRGMSWDISDATAGGLELESNEAEGIWCGHLELGGDVDCDLRLEWDPGTVGQVLVSQGPNKTPKWTNTVIDLGIQEGHTGAESTIIERLSDTSVADGQYLFSYGDNTCATEGTFAICYKEGVVIQCTQITSTGQYRKFTYNTSTEALEHQCKRSLGNEFDYKSSTKTLTIS